MDNLGIPDAGQEFTVRSQEGTQILRVQGNDLYVLGELRDVEEGFGALLVRAAHKGDCINFEDGVEFRLPGHRTPLAAYLGGKLWAYGQPATREVFTAALKDWVDYVLDEPPSDIESIS